MSKILICGEEKLRKELNGILSDTRDLILVDTIEMCQEVMKNAEISTLLLDLDTKGAFEAVEQIHSNNPAIKIVVIANYRATEKAEEAVRLGASGYMVQPITSEKILSVCK